MANINQVKKKSIGTIRTIFNKLKSLNLKQYYFESALLLMNVILRPSILYAADMYYDLKEGELRQLERIEEQFLRKIFKTTKGCPITQLYLEIGQFPARFEIQKMRMLYLKYILEQEDKSTLKKFLKLQIGEPNRGDWASTCRNDLEELKIELSYEQIKVMTKSKFTNILKQKITENALKYLLEKQGSKGKEILYTHLEMAEYLLPCHNKISVGEKQEIFAMRNRMVDIPQNNGNKSIKCICNETENMKHIYICEILSEKSEHQVEYEEIYNGNFDQQKQVFEIFRKNMEKRKTITSKIIFPCDLSDPLYTVMD